MGVVYSPPSQNLDILHIEDVQYIDLVFGTNDSFVEGEWAGEDADGNAVKIADLTFLRPTLVLTGTNRNDVKESGKITTGRGKFRAKSKIYSTGKTWTTGSKIAVISEGGKGVLAPVPAAAGTYKVVGEVITGPAQDGDFLLFDRYADDKEVTVS